MGLDLTTLNGTKNKKLYKLLYNDNSNKIDLLKVDNQVSVLKKLDSNYSLWSLSENKALTKSLNSGTSYYYKTSDITFYDTEITDMYVSGNNKIGSLCFIGEGTKRSNEIKNFHSIDNNLKIETTEGQNYYIPQGQAYIPQEFRIVIENTEEEDMTLDLKAVLKTSKVTNPIINLTTLDLNNSAQTENKEKIILAYTANSTYTFGLTESPTELSDRKDINNKIIYKDGEYYLNSTEFNELDTHNSFMLFGVNGCELDFNEQDYLDSSNSITFRKDSDRITIIAKEIIETAVLVSSEDLDLSKKEIIFNS